MVPRLAFKSYYLCLYIYCLFHRFDETVMLTMDVLPKLNYLSMSWNDHSTSDSRSPADMTSVIGAVNAAAVKYLNDQQLVQQAAAAARKGKKASPSAESAALLSNATVYGIKSANLSLASRKYFEKHQLAANKAHQNVPEPPQSSTRRQMSNSKLEDLLNSISSQVNGLQMTMSPEHSSQKNSRIDDSSQYFNNITRQSDLSLSYDSECSKGIPTRLRSRKSFDVSALSDNLLDETYVS